MSAIDISDILGDGAQLRTELNANDAVEILACFDGEELDENRLVLALGPLLTKKPKAVIKALVGDEAAALTAACYDLASRDLVQSITSYEEIVGRVTLKKPTIGDYADAERFGHLSKLVVVAKALGEEPDKTGQRPAVEFLALHRAVMEQKKGGPKSALLLRKIATLKDPPTPEESPAGSQADAESS